MAFTRVPVRMPGILTGGGFKVYCSVSAVRVTLSGTGLFKDCRYCIDWVAISLPAGNYKLSIEGMTVNMCYSEHRWQAT